MRGSEPLRRIARPLLLLLAVAFTGPVPLAADPPRPAEDAPFLWHVRGPTATHYLVGSVHLLPKSVKEMPSGIRQAFAASRSLVFESNIEALSDRAGTAVLLKAAIAPQGLAAEIDADTHERVRVRARALSMPPELCDRHLPWFCALSLELFASQQAGLVSEFGLDHRLHRDARAAKKTVTWFESPAVHLALFTEMPVLLSRQFLATALESGTRKEDQPIRVYEAWRDNDVGYLQSVVAELKRDYRGLHDRLLADRNRIWLPQLLRHLNETDTQMIVVGAAHWVGPDGLLASLRAAGYDIRPGIAADAVAATAGAP